MNECIFCRIIENLLPSDTVYEDDDIIAFKDVNPQAPVHILIVPKRHIVGINQIDSTNSFIISKIFEQARVLAEEFHLDNGYRIVTNVGEDGGQSVKHLHFHLLGGKKLNTTMV